MIRQLLPIILLASHRGAAQSCPSDDTASAPSPSQPRALTGRLIFHNGMRRWFELKLSQPVCGQSSIQLVRLHGSWKPLEELRGCQVTSHGPLDRSETSYYSLDINQDVDSIAPSAHCKPRAPFPDLSNAKPSPGITSYHVAMHLNFSPGDHPIRFHITSGGRSLSPWQAYASYSLTGGLVLFGQCASGFASIRSTVRRKPSPPTSQHPAPPRIAPPSTPTAHRRATLRTCACPTPASTLTNHTLDPASAASQRVSNRPSRCISLSHAALRCFTLPFAAFRCPTLPHAAFCCFYPAMCRPSTASHCSTLLFTAPHCPAIIYT